MQWCRIAGCIHLKGWNWIPGWRWQSDNWKLEDLRESFTNLFKGNEGDGSKVSVAYDYGTSRSWRDWKCCDSRTGVFSNVSTVSWAVSPRSRRLLEDLVVPWERQQEWASLSEVDFEPVNNKGRVLPLHQWAPLLTMNVMVEDFVTGKAGTKWAERIFVLALENDQIYTAMQNVCVVRNIYFALVLKGVLQGTWINLKSCMVWFATHCTILVGWCGFKFWSLVAMVLWV